MRALVVEDDPDLLRQLSDTLRAEGYAVDQATDGEEAMYLGEVEPYDVVVLDLGLPVMDGVSVLKGWRAKDRTMPVLILTARGSWPERVEGIDAGADDYLPKPFQMAELIARVRGLIRRTAGHASAVIENGSLSIDTRQMRVLVDGVVVPLTPLEYRLVSFLIHNKGRVVTPGELLDHLYGDDDAREANALEALVMRTRKKLGPDFIETRRGFGYLIPDAVP